MNGPFTWVFALSPLPAGATRLTLRTRAMASPRPLIELGKPFIYLAAFLLARQLLWGVKKRAEKLAAR